MKAIRHSEHSRKLNGWSRPMRNEAESRVVAIAHIMDAVAADARTSHFDGRYGNSQHDMFGEEIERNVMILHDRMVHGMTYKALGAKYGVSVDRARQIAVKYRGHLRTRVLRDRIGFVVKYANGVSLPLIPESVSNAIQLRRGGYDFSDIEGVTGESENRIHHWSRLALEYLGIIDPDIWQNNNIAENAAEWGFAPEEIAALRRCKLVDVEGQP